MSDAAAPTADQTQTDLSNWREAGFNRWGFRHVREIVPTADIAAGSDVMPLPADPRGLDDFRLPTGDGPGLSLEDFQAATDTDALVILQDGRLVHEFYDPGMTADTRHIIMSASKSITGLIAGVLQDRGVIDLDGLVSDLVPEIADMAYRGATLRHLLDMRTGVRLNEADLARYEAATGWDPLPAGQPTGDLHGFFQAMTTPHQPHGGPFSYISANTDLLGWALERATGQSFAELVSQKLWRPMGAEHDAYITTDSAGAARCTGGLCMTARDLARVGQLMVGGGRRGEVQIIPKGLIEDIALNGDHEAWNTGEFAPAFGTHMRYRGGWYVIDSQPQILFAMGIHGQNLFIDRTNRIVIAKLSRQTPRINYRAVGLTHQAVPALIRYLTA